MSERNFDSEFWQMVVHEVSREPEIRDAIRWIMGETVSLESMPVLDHYDTLNLMHSKYGINEEQLFKAYAIREQEEAAMGSLDGEA